MMNLQIFSFFKNKLLDYKKKSILTQGLDVKWKASDQAFQFTEKGRRHLGRPRKMDILEMEETVR